METYPYFSGAKCSVLLIYTDYSKSNIIYHLLNLSVLCVHRNGHVVIDFKFISSLSLQIQWSENLESVFLKIMHFTLPTLKMLYLWI